MLQLAHGLCTQITIGYRCSDEKEGYYGSSDSYGITNPRHLDADGTVVVLFTIGEIK